MLLSCYDFMQTFLRQKITLSSSCECSEGCEMNRDIKPRNQMKPSDKVSDASSKANKNTMGSRVLRYALHLRFLCPYPKKSARIQRRTTEVLAARTGNDMCSGSERRFYLYNDLRVVFPQRQSDSDEGKVHASLYHIFLSCILLSVSH